MKTSSLVNSLRCVGLVVAVIGGAAHADNSAPGGIYESRSATVRYADLDLSSTDGLQSLYARLDMAADRVCGRADGRDLKQFADWRSCRKAALDSAVAGVRDDRLSALHEQQAGVPNRRSMVASN